MPTKIEAQRDPLVREMESLGDCLTPDSALRLLRLKADPGVRARVEQLGERCSEGTLTPDEREEYRRYVDFSTVIAYLKSRARLLLAGSRSRP
jgi:hypothetical protein